MVELVGVEDLFGDEGERFGAGIQCAIEAGLIPSVALACGDGDFEQDAILVAVEGIRV